MVGVGGGIAKGGAPRPAAEIVFAAAVDKIVAYTYFAKVAYATN
jgi:hypothetical protein